MHRPLLSFVSVHGFPQKQPSDEMRRFLSATLGAMTFASPDNVDARLLRPYTRIRNVEPPHAPWSAVLARTADEVEVLLVDTEKFSPEWAWQASPEGHVLGPLDLLRTHSGHVVALPLCTERLTSFLHRRSASNTSLRVGESITILVSVLRGTLESFALGGDEVTGVWWLTHEGRPVLIPGGDQRLLDAAIEAVIATAENTLDGALNAEAKEIERALYARESLEMHITDIEAALFAHATAQPIATAGIRASASLLAPQYEGATRDVQEERHLAAPSWATTLMPHIDSGVRELFETALGQLKMGRRRPQTQSKPRRRRNAWLWAAGITAALIAAGLAWPANSDSGPGQEASEIPTGASSTRPTESPELPLVVEDPVAALSMLLAARRKCQSTEDSGCLDMLMLDSAIAIPEGAVDLPLEDVELSLIDDYGGAASVGVRARGEEMNSQVAVVVQTEKTWVLREVFTVAQHP